MSLYNDATKAIMTDNYEAATKLLTQLTASDPRFIDAWILLGELYKEQGDFEKGKAALDKAISLDPDYSSKANFFLAECAWNLDEYDTCIDACERYFSFTDISKARKSEAERYLANARFAIEAIKNPVPFNPQNLGDKVNTEMPEYLPSLTGDEKTIVFTRRVGSGRNLNEDFYSSTQNKDWSVAKPLEDINSIYNEGAQSQTPDGNTIYYVICDKPGGYGGCDIYYTTRKGNSWTAPKNVGAPVCTNAWETQPCISSDGQTLYFVSTRTGGKGGSDIWFSDKKNGKWSNPVNLGDSINTPYDEKTPFIHADGKTLYFSSNGLPGMGKDDIYYSRKKEDGSWSKPVNIGYPINTKGDENSLIVSLNGLHAYFASDRFKVKREMDLYEFDLYSAAQPGLVTYVKGIITDAETQSPLLAKIELLELESGNVITESVTNSGSGEYLVSIPAGKNYALNVSAEGYLFHSENFSLENHFTKDPFLINVKLAPIKVGSSVVLKNIFYETDSYILTPSSAVELDKLAGLLKQYASMKIEIGGHTDNQGNDTYNQKLSENRAKSVYEYLISKGIQQGRLSYKGYGRSHPIASNDSEEGRAQNRRTEFTVSAF